MGNPVIRPATRDDLVSFYGEPPARRVRALVADLDGLVVGVAGVEHAHGERVMFMDISPDLRRKKVWIMKAAREVMRRMGDDRLVAVASPNENNAPRFLERMGFQRTMVDGAEFYVYEPEGVA